MNRQLEHTISDSDPSSNPWILKTVSNAETLIALLKIDPMLCDDTRFFCFKYPTLETLYSTKWRQIEEEDLKWGSRNLIKKVWCHSVLRKKILSYELPLELADDLEEMNLTSPKDLSDENIADLGRDFTQHERRKFERWCLKEKQTSETDNRVPDDGRQQQASLTEVLEKQTLNLKSPKSLSDETLGQDFTQYECSKFEKCCLQEKQSLETGGCATNEKKQQQTEMLEEYRADKPVPKNSVMMLVSKLNNQLKFKYTPPNYLPLKDSELCLSLKGSPELPKPLKSPKPAKLEMIKKETASIEKLQGNSSELELSKNKEYFRHTKTTTNTQLKPYCEFLVDRPPYSSLTNDDMTKICLMNCLRHRLRLLPIATNDTGALGDSSFILSLDRNTRRQHSLYDTLLHLIDDYDAAGKMEIFRLLLERRSAIPLFISDRDRCHFELLNHIYLPGTDIELGKDKSLMRVAVVSCRKQRESNTPYLLKELFHIDSFHYTDNENDCITSNEVTPEIACGFLELERQEITVQPLLVLHIVGDFLPLWPFLVKFADYVIVEDEPDQQNNFYSMVQASAEGKRLMDDVIDIEDKRDSNTTIPYLLLWKPSLKNKDCVIVPKESFGFRHMMVEYQQGPQLWARLKRLFSTTSLGNQEDINRLQTVDCFYNLPIAKEHSLNNLLVHVEQMINQTVKDSLGSIKMSKLVLQKNYMKQAQYEEDKNEYRLNDEKVLEAERKILECVQWRRLNAAKVSEEPLLQLLLQLLSCGEAHERVLSIQKLERILGKISATELSPLQKLIDNRYASYMEFRKSANDAIHFAISKDAQIEEKRKQLLSARKDYNEQLLSIEHLWREISHVYASTSLEQRSGIIARASLLGAQHLLDGFSIELLDGDANMIHLEWITDVLRAVAQLIGKKNKERIFVLSVLGIQSSGKSTLLNTMFGIQMRTSVGQCTHGVNMQLIAVEGRREYDYILLLDTEGCRAPEFHGLPDSEKRDNKMATLSILLADATILVIPGENDAAVKDILPIVLLAYEDSKLAESMGGRLSSMMFFVYNRIDTSQRDNCGGIIQALGTSLHESFEQVQRASSVQFTNGSPFRSFKLNTSNSGNGESDVCVLGNVKVKYEPPGDVPDPEYGKTLRRFREHIHQRVTSTKKDVVLWQGRTILDFSKYIEEVWKCVGSANFSLNFSNVREHAAFDLLNLDYKTLERDLAESYYIAYQQMEKEMVRKKKDLTVLKDGGIDSDERLLGSFVNFETMLKNSMALDVEKYNDKFDDILNQKGRGKWVRQYENQWELCKTTQAQNWRQNLKLRFINMFTYEKQLESYKKDMRLRIRKLFENNGGVTLTMTEPKQLEMFKEIYDGFLAKAKTDFPPKDIQKDIAQVYENSPIIKKCKIDINIINETPTVLRCRQLKTELENISKTDDPVEKKNFFQRIYSSIRRGVPTTRENEQCAKSMYNYIHSLAANKRCYDNSIVEDVIVNTGNKIKSHNVSGNSSLEFVHKFSRILVTEVLMDIQLKWEKENSPYEKFKSKSNEKEMYSYFKLVSKGCQKTQLFATMMANTFEKVLPEAFEKEMIQRTFNAIRNEQWLHNARFMQKHIDLYLISLLEDDKLNEVLDYVRKPKGLYDVVLKNLTRSHIPKAQDMWQPFAKLLEVCIDTASDKIKVENQIGKCRAQVFVDELSKQFLDCKSIGLAANVLGNPFAMNCSEYEDCDAEDEKEFQKVVQSELVNVLNHWKFNETQNAFATRLSPKVIEHMIFLNDAAALPRCDVYCPMCGSLCIESMNHDTEMKKHDAVHQPSGVVGTHERLSKKLSAFSCSIYYERDNSFYPKRDSEETHKYREFSTYYTEWKDPRINEELAFREYLLATYNEDIAKKYDLLPCENIPAHFHRDLHKIRSQLQLDVGMK